LDIFAAVECAQSKITFATGAKTAARRSHQMRFLQNRVNILRWVSATFFPSLLLVVPRSRTCVSSFDVLLACFRGRATGNLVLWAGFETGSVCSLRYSTSLTPDRHPASRQYVEVSVHLISVTAYPRFEGRTFGSRATSKRFPRRQIQRQRRQGVLIYCDNGLSNMTRNPTCLRLP